MAFARRNRAAEYEVVEKQFTEGHLGLLRSVRDKLLASTVERVQCMEFAPPHLKVEFEEIVKRDVYEMLLDVSCAVETVSAEGDDAPPAGKLPFAGHSDAALEDKVATLAELNAKLMTDGQALEEKLRATELSNAALKGQVVHRDALLNKQRSTFLKQLVDRDIRAGQNVGSGPQGAQRRESTHSNHDIYALDVDDDASGAIDDRDGAGAAKDAQTLAALERNIQTLKETHEKERQLAEKARHDTQLAHMQEVEELRRAMRQLDLSYKEMLANASGGGVAVATPLDTPASIPEGEGTGDADMDDATRHNAPPVPISVPGGGVDVCVQCDPDELEPRATPYAQSGTDGAWDMHQSDMGSREGLKSTSPTALSPAHPPPPGWEAGGETTSGRQSSATDIGSAKQHSSSVIQHASAPSSQGNTRPSTPHDGTPQSRMPVPSKKEKEASKGRKDSRGGAATAGGGAGRRKTTPSTDDGSSSSEGTDTTGNETTSDEDDSSSSRSSERRSKRAPRTVKASAAPEKKKTQKDEKQKTPTSVPLKREPSAPRMAKKDSTKGMRPVDSFKGDACDAKTVGSAGQLPPVSPQQSGLHPSMSQSAMSRDARTSPHTNRGQGTPLQQSLQRGSMHSSSHTHPDASPPSTSQAAGTPLNGSATHHTPTGSTATLSFHPPPHVQPPSQRLSEASHPASQQHAAPAGSSRLSHDSASTHQFAPQHPHGAVPVHVEHPAPHAPPSQPPPRPLLTKTADTMVKAVEAKHKKELALLHNELAIKEQVLDQVLRDVDSLRQNNADAEDAMGRLQQYKKVRQQHQEERETDDTGSDHRRSDAPPTTGAPPPATSQNLNLLLDLRKEINMKNKVLKEKQIEIDTMASNLQTLHGAMAQRLHTINLQIVEKVRTSVQTAEAAEEVYRVSGWTLLAMGVRFGKILTRTIAVLREDQDVYRQNPQHIRIVQRAVELLEHRFAVAMASQRHERSCLKDLSNRNWDRVLFYARSMVQAPKDEEDPPTHQVPFAMQRPQTADRTLHGQHPTAPSPSASASARSVAGQPAQPRKQQQRPSTAPMQRDDMGYTDTKDQRGQRREKVLAMLHRDRKQLAESKVKERQKKARDAIAPIFGDAAKVYRLVASRS
eukprot:TRINITY_DN18242_c0_g1_i1.p1 TRINITY_DN18242_c0_g1~~TRINITY_DN18242_c0_g1_i1.p1  ORF type:complete len:1123 (+),score=270.10 TRINITY_DN18242_c0_g1_i1:123-3491(+)